MTHKLLVILHCLFVVTDTQRSSHLVEAAFGKSLTALLCNFAGEGQLPTHCLTFRLKAL